MRHAPCPRDWLRPRQLQSQRQRQRQPTPSSNTTSYPRTHSDRIVGKLPLVGVRQKEPRPHFQTVGQADESRPWRGRPRRKKRISRSSSADPHISPARARSRKPYPRPSSRPKPLPVDLDLPDSTATAQTLGTKSRAPHSSNHARGPAALLRVSNDQHM